MKKGIILTILALICQMAVVAQNGGRIKLEARPDSVHFSREGETVAVSIVTNAKSWQVDLVPDWIEYKTKDNVLLLTSKQNNLARVRGTTIFIVAQEEECPISVSQDATDAVLSVDKKELVFSCKESEDYFLVESNMGQMQVLPSDDWIYATIKGDTVRIYVESNETLFSRHGRVEVGTDNRFCSVQVHQHAFTSIPPFLKPELSLDENSSKESFAVTSVPSDLKVTVIDDGGESRVRRTPFEMPMDYGRYSLTMGFETREVFANEQQQDVVFNPGLRFATITWSPLTTLGMMSGFVGAKSWGAYAHFRASLPVVTDFIGENRELDGYNITFGPVFRPNRFPYVGAYAGIGIGGYVKEPHVGLDYEAGLMGFYKNYIFSMGFHTSRINASWQQTSFTLGIGGYLKRYYDPELGYCASDSRRWTSLNYVFRPSEHGNGLMVGDMGKERVRMYAKAMYLTPDSSSDSIRTGTDETIKNVEAGLGIVFTPVNGIIDLCLGASGAMNISGLENRFQGIGVEVGTILNLWRFPITVFLHESDVFGERHLCVDFGVGFHLGEFEKSKCSYQ